MSRCIEVMGYLALFDVKESDKMYVIGRNNAQTLIKVNRGKTIPIVISHLNFRVDLTIGYVTNMTVNNKGLYCTGVIDNAAFLEAHNIMRDDFLQYFSSVDPTPFLYLKACLPSFSLSHDKNSFGIKHVALVDIGARRGSLVTYRFLNREPSESYSAKCIDFLVVLGLYTRNTIKLAKNRSNCLFTDAMLCGENDIAFINAGMSESEKNINVGCQQLRLKQQTMSSMEDALDMIGTIASVLSNKRKRQTENVEEEQPVKRQKQQPITHASQTFETKDPQLPSTSNQTDDMNKFRDEMRQMQKEFMEGQANMMKELFSQTMQARNAMVETPSVPKHESQPSAANTTVESEVPMTQESSSSTTVAANTAEDALIQAGMHIDESEHLINELFRQFIQKNFTVRKNYTK